LERKKQKTKQNTTKENKIKQTTTKNSGSAPEKEDRKLPLNELTETMETGERIPGLRDSLGDLSGSTFSMILLLFSTSRILALCRCANAGEFVGSWYAAGGGGCPSFPTKPMHFGNIY
jgi:hypothetical protein